MKKIKLTEYIRKSATQVSLSESERARMERVLSEYVAMKPMRNAPLDRRAPLSYMFLSLYAFSKRSVALVLIAGILFSGAGVSFAAENALPGDALYPIKVEVNEPLVAALSVSSEAKVLWNAARAERRLEEAAKLAVSGELTEEKQEDLQERFEEHAERFAVDVERLEAEDAEAAVDIASRFENRLLAHEVVLDDAKFSRNLRQLKGNVKTQVLRLARVSERAQHTDTPSPAAAVAVADTAGVAVMMSASAPEVPPENVAAKSRVAITQEVAPVLEVAEVAQFSEPTVVVKPEDLKRVARSATKELEEVKKSFERTKEKMNSETTERVAVRIQSAQEHILRAEEYVTQKDFRGAVNAYRESVSVSVQLSVLLKAYMKSRISIIPAELFSHEERLEAVMELNETEKTENTSVPLEDEKREGN